MRHWSRFHAGDKSDASAASTAAGNAPASTKAGWDVATLILSRADRCRIAGAKLNAPTAE
jgi:hypothetical protein